MNTSERHVLVVAIVCSYFVFVNGKYNLTQLERTWIVRNTSDVNENNNCPFVIISKAAQNTTANFKYTSDAHPDIYATLQDTNGTIKLLNDEGSVIGNVEILKDNVPYYLLIRTNTTVKGLPPYIVLTGMYQLPVEVEREITQFWNTNNATKNVTLYSTKQEPVRCRSFLVSSGIDPPLNNTIIETGNNATNSSSIPKPGSGNGYNATGTSYIPKPAAGNNGTSTVSTQRPPKSASSCVSPNFLFTVTFLHVCFYLKKFI
ncbi:hypothetical protein WA026_005025 [Henosepilachna vigintioctopunctata]|uniref:Uncharacterized protein n=1 Tax=Henosepilachna vigintioctopunctata TaxID=420089 RepID=A0AAW1UVT1_9CUCU